MTEIDNLARLSLRDLKPYFTHCKQLKEKVEAHTKGKTLEERIDFAERNFPKIEHLLRWDITFTRTTLLGESKRVLNVEAVIDPLDIDIVGFKFRWESEGQQKERHIAIETAQSNLGLNPVRYFVCPHTHKRCRKLYTDWRDFYSRYAFPHTYSQRNYSHRWREDVKVIDYMRFVEKDFKGRKEYYRGKLTPFGRKVRSMAGGETLEEAYIKQTARIEKFLNRPIRGRGRPMKPVVFKKPRGKKQKPSSPPLFMK